MGNSGEQHPTSRIQRDIIDRGEELLEQLTKESQSLGNIDRVDSELATQRNELLFKLNDQIENAKEALQQTWQGRFLEILKIGEQAIKLPIQMDRVLTDIMNGRIHVENSFSADARRCLQQLNRSIKGLTWGVLAVGLWLSGIYLQVETHHKHWGMLLLGIAIFALVKGLKKG